MPRAAFSTVACPDWTLDRAVRAAAEYGFQGLELRTFGYGSTELACDPALTSAAKVRHLFADTGVHAACLATGTRFDHPVRPPVIGRLFADYERSVRQAKAAIDLAAQIECPLVRFFGFEIPQGEARHTALRRITDRLHVALDAARNTGVRVVIENGGTFARAADLADLIDRAAEPLLGAAYCNATGLAAGDEPTVALRLLGARLRHAKVKELAAGRPCPLGSGDASAGAFVRAVAASSADPWIVFEWDRLWLPDLAPPEDVLPAAARRIFEWAARTPAALQPA